MVSQGIVPLLSFVWAIPLSIFLTSVIQLDYFFNWVFISAFSTDVIQLVLFSITISWKIEWSDYSFMFTFRINERNVLVYEASLSKIHFLC